MQFVGHASRLWWNGVYDICEFWPARTGIKGVISVLLLLLHLLLHSRTERTSVLTWQVRKTGPVAKQLKGFIDFVLFSTGKIPAILYFEGHSLWWLSRVELSLVGFLNGDVNLLLLVESVSTLRKGIF